MEYRYDRSRHFEIPKYFYFEAMNSTVGGRNTLKILAEKAGYEYYYFCKAIDYQGGEYGTAIMSKYPIKSFEVIPLYGEDGIERRAMGHAVIDVNGTEIDYINTHLSYEKTRTNQKPKRERKHFYTKAGRDGGGGHTALLDADRARRPSVLPSALGGASGGLAALR